MVRTVESIQEEIKKKLGFVPPFFFPAFENPLILEDLWSQTRIGYLENPLPDLFKEKLAALLARYCTTPYCLVCHSSTLKPLGLSMREVLELLETDNSDQNQDFAVNFLRGKKFLQWPAQGSGDESAILTVCVAIFLNQSTASMRKILRDSLPKKEYDYLTLFLGYNRVALNWSEAHPELSYEADQRFINISPELADFPALRDFFSNYGSSIRAQSQRQSSWLSRENRNLLDLERERLNSYFAQAPIGFAVLKEPQHRIVSANPKFVELFALKNYSERFIRDVLTGDQYSPIFESFDKSFTDGSGTVAVAQEIRPGVFVDITVEPYRNSDNLISGIIVILNDVSERIRNQRDLERERLLLSEIFDRAPALMAIWEGKDLVYRKVNPQYQALFEDRQLIGLPFEEAIPELRGSAIALEMRKVFETGATSLFEEAPVMIRFAGADQPVERFFTFNFIALRNEAGEIFGVFNHAVDVTAGVLGRKILAQSEARLAEITNTLPLIAWTARPDGFVDWYNDIWYEFTGMPRGTNWDDAKSPMHPDDLQKIHERWRASLGSGNQFEIEYRLWNARREEYRWQVARANPIYENEVIVKWTGSITDIHDQRLLVEALQEQKDSRERFVAALTHDLKTPLAGARMSAQLVQKKVEDPRVREWSDRVIHGLDRADKMINDLLDANRIEAGEGIPLKRLDCDISEIATEVYNRFLHQLGPRFSAVIPSYSIQGFWDCSAITRVLENLIGNAVKYGDSNGEIKFRLSDGPDSIQLSVHNRGIPISTAEQLSIFLPYKRSKTVTHGTKVGWGVGLSLVRGIAEAHGGSVTLESDENSGTLFIVSLPKLVHS